MSTSTSSFKSFITAGIVVAGIGVATWFLMFLGYLQGGAESYGLIFAAAGVLLLVGLLSYIRSKSGGKKS